MQHQSKHNIRVIMAGPLPPLIGGMATVIEDISKSSLPDRVDLQLFNTGKTTPQDRSLWQGVLSKFTLWKEWLTNIHSNSNTIVHIHTCSGFTFFLDGILLMLARLKNCPSILHIHGAQFDRFLDSLPPPGLWLARWISKKATMLVVLSEEWHEKLSHRLPNALFTVIKNGVPVPEIPKQQANKKTIKILFLGNLSSRKGVWDLVHAMKNTPDNVQLELAGGEDEPKVGEKLKSEITQLGLTRKITWLGPVFGEEKKHLVENADIFVLPSYAEGLPISLLEAMCAGLPVVTTPVGGIPSVVTGGKQGLLVEPGDIDGLQKALTNLVLDGELRIKLGENARNTCAENFGIERVVDKYMALYTTILNK